MFRPNQFLGLRHHVLEHVVEMHFILRLFGLLGIQEQEGEHPDDAPNDQPKGTPELIGEAHRSELPLGLAEVGLGKAQAGAVFLDDGAHPDAGDV